MRTTTTLLALLLALAAAPPALGQAPPQPTLSVDTFFGPPAGIADADFSPTNIVPDVPTAVAVDGDRNRIYTVGRTGSSSSANVGIIARHLNGPLDLGFDDDGMLAVPVTAGNVEDDGRGIVVLPDGRIRVLATTGSSTSKDVVVLGFEADGDPDPAFGVGGKRVFTNPGEDAANRIAVGPDGRLAIVGSRKVNNRDDVFVAQIDANGTPVAGFGTDGMKVVDQGGPAVNDRGRDVAFRPGGGLLVLVEVDSPLSVYLRAFQANGDPDPSFAGGALRLDVGGTNTLAGGLIEHGGRYYVSGSTQVSGDTNAFIARVEANGGGLQHRLFDMRGRHVGVGQAAISHAADLVAVPGAPEALVAVGTVRYTPEGGSTIDDWAAAAFNNFGGDLAEAGYGDLVIAAPGNGGLFSVAVAPDRSLAVAGRHLESSDDGFGNARLLLDAEKRCDLALSVAEPAEVTFSGAAPAAVTATVRNNGTRACGGTLGVHAPYRLGAVSTGEIAPGASFTASGVELAYDGPRRAEDLLLLTLTAPDDRNGADNQAIVHVVFSYCNVALRRVGSAGLIPNEGARRFDLILRNTGTAACRVRVGGKPRYSLRPGQSASDRLRVAAPKGAAIGKRVGVVLRAGALGDIDAGDDAVGVSPRVVGVGDSDIHRTGARGFAGTATNGRGKGVKRKRLRPVRVEVAVLRRGGERCSWLASPRGGFAGRRRSKDGRCTAPRWLRADRLAQWQFRLRQPLPAGRYHVYSRATIAAGFPEARFSGRDRNKIAFTVR